MQDHIDATAMEKAVTDFLVALGEDPEREGLRETPRRVTKYWEELTEGMNYTNEEIAKMYGKCFEVDNDSLVVRKVENIYSHCEHHLALMYNMTATVAYLPLKLEDGHYRVIGLSKIPRIVELCAKRLQLQEKLANDIADCISKATGSCDIFVNIVGDHACVAARGAKNEGRTDVTVAKGRFSTDSALRAEVEQKSRRIASITFPMGFGVPDHLSPA